MPSALKKTLIVLTLLLTLAAALLLVLAGTERGTRLLAEEAKSRSGGTLDWDGLQGTLLGSLELQGLRMRQPGLTLDIDDLALSWRPAALLRSRLHVERLELEGLRAEVSDTGQETPPGEPLRFSDLQPPLDIQVQLLRVRDISLRQGEQAQRVDLIELAARVDEHQLWLERLEVRAPQGGLQAGGRATLDEDLPFQFDLAWHWRLPDQRRVGGQLQARGTARTLSVEHTGSGDLPVNLRGELTNLVDSPGWEVDLDWPELPLAAGEAPLLVGPGRLQSSGTLEQYRLTGEGRFQGMGLEATLWSLQARGNAAALQLEPLTLTNPRGELALDGAVQWSGPIACDLQYRAGSDQLAGFNPDLPPRLDATGRIRAGLEGEVATLEVFSLALEQSPLQLELRGNLTLPAAEEPAFDGRLQWRELQWPLAGSPGFASPEGHLAVAGTVDAYRFNLAAGVAGEQVPPGTWQGDGSGDGAGLVIDRLEGALLGGKLALSGPVTWSPALAWQLQSNGQDLDPGQWLPELPGRLALALHTSGQVDPETGAIATLELEQLSGRLADRDLALSARAALAGDVVELQQLQLESAGNRLSARGTLSSELALDWQLQAPNPSALLPGSAGELAAGGRVEGTPGEPRLRATLDGGNLRLDTLSLPSLRAELTAGLGAEDPLRLDVELGPLQEGDQVLVQAARLRANGKTTDHRLQLDLQRPAERLRATLEGGLNTLTMAWSGRLAALDAESDAYGAWQLAEPAPLVLSAKSLELGAACLQAAAHPGRVCGQGEWDESRGIGLSARLQALSLAQLSGQLSGDLNGELDAKLDAEGALAARAALELGPGQVRAGPAQGQRQLAHDGGRVDLTIGPGGLDGEVLLKSAGKPLLQAQLQLPRFNSLPPSQPQPLAGRIRADLEDLGALQPWLPQLDAMAGRLYADLGLAGTLDQPRILGELALADGAVDIPQAGLQLRQVELRANDDPEHPGQLILAGGLASGPGRVDLDGRLDLAALTVDLVLRGERLEVLNTPDGRALASPDLRIGWSNETLVLRGAVVIPEATITPRLGISPGSPGGEPVEGQGPGRIIAPSPDVIVLNAEREEPEQPMVTAPFRLDSQIDLILGKRVKVSALGFNSRIAGAVQFINAPGQKDLIPIADGRFSIEDGTFRSFGQDLEIETGQVIFALVPVTEPELNVRAVRWIDDDPQVDAAGVLVTGSGREPVVALFSRPQLDDPSEVQSYLLTGRGPSAQERVLSVGTYLNPKLYVGYGYNLLEQTSEFNSLYTITPRYGVEAKVGEADNSLNLTFTHEN